MLTTEHFLWSVNTPGTRHRKYECNIWHWFGQRCSALVLVRVASTLAIRTRSKLNRCETTSRRWFSLIRFKSLLRISWCSVNARIGAKPVSLRIKSASVNGVLVKGWHNISWEREAYIQIHGTINGDLYYEINSFRIIDVPGCNDMLPTSQSELALPSTASWLPSHVSSTWRWAERIFPTRNTQKKQDILSKKRESGMALKKREFTPKSRNVDTYGHALYIIGQISRKVCC